MKQPIWMYFLVIDADGVVVETFNSPTDASVFAEKYERECHVYRVDKWTRTWPPESRGGG